RQPGGRRGPLRDQAGYPRDGAAAGRPARTRRARGNRRRTDRRHTDTAGCGKGGLTDMSLHLSYGTNGFGDHRLSDAVEVIAELGYTGVALTLDHHHLDPFAPSISAETAALRRQLTRLGLDTVVETGARYLLDPRHKHEPTLVSAGGRDLRVDFLHRAIDVAAELGSPVVHLWSGVLPAGDTVEAGWQRLLDGMAQILPNAEAAGVDLAFEPEPGMFIERLADVRELQKRLGNPERLRYTIDVGHALCNEEAAPEEIIQAAGDQIAHIQIEDMRR